MLSIRTVSALNDISKEIVNDVNSSCRLPANCIANSLVSLSSNAFNMTSHCEEVDHLLIRNSSDLTIKRNEITFPLPRKYHGFDRLNRTLRHLASVIFQHMKKVFSVDPKEIQIGIILNQIHISSNFHSDKIIDALVNIFKANQNKKEALYGEKTSYKTQRTLRHENALKRFLERDNFLAILSAGIREIETETAEFKGTNLTQEELINQFTSGMNSIYFAFEKCIKNNDFSGIHISPSYHHGPLGVRHAERNIVNYLVEYKDEIYSKAIKMHRLADGKHIILPLDGRFIPCGFCYEQECSDMDEGGVFDPKMNRFLLYRSGKRVGKFYEGEVQYMFSSGFHSDPSIAKMKAMAMLENIKNSSDKLYCYGTDIVTESSFNTDSEQSDNEIDDAIK